MTGHDERLIWVFVILWQGIKINIEVCIAQQDGRWWISIEYRNLWEEQIGDGVRFHDIHSEYFVCKMPLRYHSGNVENKHGNGSGNPS